jgi:hypothetical protein
MVRLRAPRADEVVAVLSVRRRGREFLLTADALEDRGAGYETVEKTPSTLPSTP